MSNKGLYIGIRNGVVLCVDEPMQSGGLLARLYHGYREDAAEVHSIEELLQVMEQLFDEIQFPRASMRDRSFRERRQQVRRPVKRKERIMSDNEMLSKHGDIGTFIIRVQQRQNNTWQGRITWVDEDKTIRFRSALEMIKLIESGIAGEDPDHGADDGPTWD